MYQINPLRRNVLITASEVKFHGATAQTVDYRQIEQAIIIAEERFIKPALCKGLYEDFRSRKNVVVTADNITDLTTKINDGNTGQPIVLVNGDIINAIELVVTDKPDYKTLWDEYLCKVIAEAVIYTATPTNYSSFASQGEMINNPKTPFSTGAESATYKDVTWKMDKMLMDRIDPLLTAMHDWLCDNKAKFPLYNCRACASGCDGKSGEPSKRKSAWVTGIYNKRRREGCCD